MSLVTLGIGGSGGTTFVTFGLGEGAGLFCPLRAKVRVVNTLDGEVEGTGHLAARVTVVDSIDAEVETDTCQ